MFGMLKSMDAVLIVTNSDYTDPSLKKMLTNCVEELRSLFAFKSMFSSFQGSAISYRSIYRVGE